MSNDFIINGITVQTIDNTSGIFIGHNNVNNWSSFAKNNNGFGSVNSSKVLRNVNVVIDNDLLDFPVDKNVLKTISVDKEGDHYELSGMETDDNQIKGLVKKIQEIGKIDVEQINVNMLNTNAAISIGDNLINRWSSQGKHNDVIRNSTGLAQYKFNTNIIIDNDVFDALFK